MADESSNVSGVRDTLGESTETASWSQLQGEAPCSPSADPVPALSGDNTLRSAVRMRLIQRRNAVALDDTALRATAAMLGGVSLPAAPWLFGVGTDDATPSGRARALVGSGGDRDGGVAASVVSASACGVGKLTVVGVGAGSGSLLTA